MMQNANVITYREKRALKKYTSNSKDDTIDKSRPQATNGGKLALNGQLVDNSQVDVSRQDIRIGRRKNGHYFEKFA